MHPQDDVDVIGIWLVWLFGGIFGVIVLLLVICYCCLMPRNQKPQMDPCTNRDDSPKEIHWNMYHIPDVQIPRGPTRPVSYAGHVSHNGHTSHGVHMNINGHVNHNSHMITSHSGHNMSHHEGHSHSNCLAHSNMEHRHNNVRTYYHEVSTYNIPMDRSHERVASHGYINKAPTISEITAQYASSSMLDEMVSADSEDSLKTRSLPAFLRSKQRPLSTEDDLYQLYAKVKFSKKRRNRMRHDDAAVIALSKSRSQCLNADAVIVYDERTAL